MRYVVTAGEIYGRLTVLSQTRKVMPGGTIRRAAECRCDCGTVTTVEIRDLKRGITRSCGCLSREKSAERGRARVRHIIRPGDRFGRLTVIREVHTYTQDGRAGLALALGEAGDDERGRRQVRRSGRGRATFADLAFPSPVFDLRPEVTVSTPPF